MPLLTSYAHLKKKSSTGKYLTFVAPRAVGLAVEGCHALARAVGLGEVSVADMQRVHVVGDLKIYHNGSWRACKGGGGCGLSLEPEDTQVALEVLAQQRAFLSDMGLNLWHINW